LLSLVLAAGSVGPAALAQQAEEPVNPFGPAATATPRDDARSGWVELSDGTRHAGQVFLTRETRLRVYDTKAGKFREVPLTAVSRITCKVDREWLEREWRFKENANDEKYYTGRTYPAREYTHVITLKDGRTIQGPLSAIVYVQDEGNPRPERFLLHKRDKGAIGMPLAGLVYVRTVELERPAEPGEKPADGPSGASNVK
jgi:hypothetical protein